MPTEEQKRNRLLATQNLEQGLPQDTGFDNTSISSDTLQGFESPIDVTPFETPTIPTIEGLPTVSEQFRATLAPVEETQKKKTALEQRIEELEGVKETIPTRTAELEKEQEIAAKRTQITDLESQFQTIIAQQKAIPLQLQEEARGRGITTAGLRPLETARLRTNTIRALGVSATLQAAQGNLATALDLIDRSIELEFGQQEAELARRREQLEFVREDLSVAERKRADALDRALDREERDIAEQKRVRTQVQNMAIQAAQKGADAQTIRAIQNARTIEDATLIATASGVFRPEEISALEQAKTQTELARGAKLRAEIEQIGVPSVKLPTGTQRVAAGFATRIEQASQIIDELETQFTGAISRIGFVPEALKSEDRKRIEQAERNFVNAVLRRESGAAIAPSEFVSAELQYFPQRGDTQEVLNQKQRNRQIAFESLRLEAGDAFAQLKEVLPPLIQDVTINGTKYPVGTIIENNTGQRGRIEADGTITII